MHGLIRALVVVVMFFAVPAVGAAGTAGAGTPSVTWPSLEHTALVVAAAQRGDGSLVPNGAATAVVRSSVTTAEGPVGVAQRTVVAVDGSGPVVVQLSLLGGSQLVVDEQSPTDVSGGAVLVLRPGSDHVVGTYPIDRPTAATPVDVSGRVVEAVETAPLHPPHPRRRLVTAGGCYGSPQTPLVIGSTFGPLVQGEGIVSCSLSESLSVIAALYSGSSQLGTAAGGSATGYYLAVDVYYGCSLTTGTRSFHTAELWAVDNVLEGGATSGSANLHCA